MPKWKFVMAAVLVVGCTTPSWASMSANYALEMLDSGDREKAEIVKLYIRGIEQGFVLANGKIEERGDRLLYCQPRTLAVAVEQLIDILRRNIAGRPRAGDFPVSMMLLEGLEKMFPCE